ncbi:diguanylate cyclase (GGDEF)-like protein [Herbinix hemicellulosilytica]|uniref:GGDEF domain-containing protein n=1 Tax=Herbinix hemicellulosilytica TaxID=1564487 RepID=A0A0H5SJI2_HERHM|nr:GGDEF domain-containing protein [Herbinix hemicellulosilytica]RBP57421.1 diguanylate cyclase (GGDEF)-like protein [Herbinix hemicellulosilytica]CRZ35667.1 hypothetical protein HHT355_2481 [Herbinix hemicellulosilytica]
MFFNGRKTIGVFISQINGEFQERLSRGISLRARELDYNVAFFTNFESYGKNEYDKGEMKIADLPSYEDLDGIILAPDTMAIEGLEQKIRENIRKRSHCPVVSVRRRIDEYYNVLVDDYKVLEQIIRHFIVDHGMTRLNFLAGPKGFPDSEKRLECYKRILAEYNIPVEEERIYYGDFWKRKPNEAVDYWLSSSMELPQAIICANDYMAITVIQALERHGLSVPKDIAVSGCDNTIDASEFYPSITTALVPVDLMGMEAVDKIDRINRGIKEKKDSYIETKTIFRESCGCKYKAESEKKGRNRRLYTRNEALQREVTRNAYMSADLTGITKLEEIDSRLRYYVYENIGFTDFYMCLYKDWLSIKEDEADIERSRDEEMIMEVGIKNRVDYSKIKFQRKYLIPPQFVDDKPLIYFFTMLHHRDIDFGYVAIAFEKIQTYMITFQAWMINVSNALENIRVHNELKRLVYKLEDMYIRDELTGLYNRRGLETLGEKYLKQAVEKKVKLMVMTVDLDKLKMINDNFGHAGGDIALKTVADALAYAADDDEICIRFGGDEFIIIGLEYNENKGKRFIKRFIEELEKFNQSGKYNFNVYVSYGWSLIQPDENTTVEECLVEADVNMYKQKHEKKALNIKGNIL